MPPVLAMPPPIFLPIFLVGLGIVVVVSTAFLGLTRRRANERNRRATLGLAAIIAGPLVGLAWALAIEAGGGVSPLDVVYQRVVLGTIGVIVGLGTGIFFAASAALARNEAQPPRTDEI